MPTMLFAQEVTNGGGAGWFLTHAWLIPVIPAVGFAVIILVGKRLPKKGSEVGIAALGAAFVLAVGTTGSRTPVSAREPSGSCTASASRSCRGPRKRTSPSRRW